MWCDREGRVRNRCLLNAGTKLTDDGGLLVNRSAKITGKKVKLIMCENNNKNH